MGKRTLRWLLLALMTAPLLAPVTAQADFLDLGGFRLPSAALSVHERDGSAVITVTRSSVRVPGQVRYGAWHLTAATGQDFTQVGGRLDFAAGQPSASFSAKMAPAPVSQRPPNTFAALVTRSNATDARVGADGT